METLRDRKKAATADALHQAAVRLAIARGLDAVTVEAIADEADVSRRTFSNYFANKEDALLHADRARMRRILAELRARPASEAPWRALRRAAAALFAEADEPDPQWVLQTRLIRRHPSVMAQQMAGHAAFERDLAEELRRRTDDPIRARVMAAAFLAGLRIGVDVWLERQGADPMGAVIDDALAAMGTQFS